MKELKFRAVMKNKNATVRFTLQDLVNPKALFSIRELLIPWLLEGNQPDRWTGKQEKNGEDVYEGDVIDFSHPKKKRKIPGEIIWNEKDACFAVNWLSEVVRRVRKEAGMPNLPGNLLTGEKGNPWGVVGNIHENPELRGQE